MPNHLYGLTKTIHCKENWSFEKDYAHVILGIQNV